MWVVTSTCVFDYRESLSWSLAPHCQTGTGRWEKASLLFRGKKNDLACQMCTSNGGNSNIQSCLLLLVVNVAFLDIPVQVWIKGQVLPLFLKQSDPLFPGKCYPGRFLFSMSKQRPGRCKCGELCPRVLCSGILVQTLLPSFCLQICACHVEPGSCLKPTISFRSHLLLTILNLLTYVPINYWYNVALFRLVSADGYIITRQTFARQADR